MLLWFRSALGERATALRFDPFGRRRLGFAVLLLPFRLGSAAVLFLVSGARARCCLTVGGWCCVCRRFGNLFAVCRCCCCCCCCFWCRLLIIWRAIVCRGRRVWLGRRGRRWRRRWCSIWRSGCAFCCSHRACVVVIVVVVVVVYELGDGDICVHAGAERCLLNELGDLLVGSLLEFDDVRGRLFGQLALRSKRIIRLTIDYDEDKKENDYEWRLKKSKSFIDIIRLSVQFSSVRLVSDIIYKLTRSRLSYWALLDVWWLVRRRRRLLSHTLSLVSY